MDLSKNIWLFTAQFTFVKIESIWSNKLCFSSHRPVPLFVWDRPYKGFSRKNEKKLTRSFNLTFLYKILEQQLSDFFENIFNPYLCAFRRGHGCQTTLLRLLEDWQDALDKNQYVAAVLMDFSKTFDCIPHDILLDKLSAYGMSTDSVSLLESYLSNRKQQIKINSILSSWADIQKKMYPKGQSWASTF